MHAVVTSTNTERAARRQLLRKMLVGAGGGEPVLRPAASSSGFHAAPTTGSHSASPPASRAASGPWLVSPVVDLLFVCGLAPWILGGLAWLMLGSPLEQMHANFANRGFTALYVICALLIGEGHQFTSIIRFHFSRRFWRKMRFQDWFPLAYMWSSLAVFFLAIFGSLNWLPSAVTGVIMSVVSLTAVLAACFPVFLVHHFAIQAQAIVMLYCSKSGYELSPGEIWRLRVATWLLVAGGACSVAVPFGLSVLPKIVELVQPYAIPLMVASLWVTVVPVIERGVRWGQWPPLAAVLVWLNLTAFLMIPAKLAVYAWVFVPIFFHASQHWLVAYAARRRETQAAGLERSAIHDLLRLVLPVQAVSLVVLFLPVLTAPVNGAVAAADLTLPVHWSMFVFYLHYFTDRIVWRPR